MTASSRPPRTVKTKEISEVRRPKRRGFALALGSRWSREEDSFWRWEVAGVEKKIRSGVGNRWSREEDSLWRRKSLE